MAQGLETAATFAANRARGTVNVVVECQAGSTRQSDVFEDGSLRVRFPTSHSRDLSAVLINTAGGIAGGDRFGIGVTVREAARLSVTTAAAEKIYRSNGEDATLDLSLRVENGAFLDWLPQETILFDHACVRRHINIDLAEGASIVFGEMVVFGRSAMEERFLQGRFVDHWRMKKEGRLIFADTVRLEGEIGTVLAEKAVASGAVAIATLLVAPADEETIKQVRERQVDQCEIGASVWNGFAIIRFCAQNTERLRAAVIATLQDIAPQRLPRLWLQ